MFDMRVRELVYMEIGKGQLILYNRLEPPLEGVSVPSEAEWQEQMPEWARDRRAEIMQCIVAEVNTQNFRYEGYPG